MTIAENESLWAIWAGQGLAGRMPNELQDTTLRIACKVSANDDSATRQMYDLQTVSDIAQTSKRLHDRFQPPLLGHVRINQTIALNRFYASLMMLQPQHRFHVRSLHLGEFKDATRPPEALNSNAITVANAILSLLPGLRTLSLDGRLRRCLVTKGTSPGLPHLCLGLASPSSHDEDSADDDEANPFDFSATNMPKLQELRIYGEFNTRCVVDTFGDVCGEHETLVPALKRTIWDLDSSLSSPYLSVGLLLDLAGDIRGASSSTRHRPKMACPHPRIDVHMEIDNLIRATPGMPSEIRRLLAPLLADDGVITNNKRALRLFAADNWFEATYPLPYIAPATTTEQQYFVRNEIWWELQAEELGQLEPPLRRRESTTSARIDS